MDLTGESVDGFAIADVLGSGPNGTVYSVASRDAGQGRQVLKALHPEMASQNGLEARFEHILSQTRSLRHSNIVRQVRFGIADVRGASVYYYVSDFGGGGSVRRLLRTTQAGSLPLALCVLLARQAAAGLQYAHAEAMMLHGGIKPENLLLSRPLPRPSGGADITAGLPSDVIVLSDFGMARMGRGTFSDAAWPYMSPEQCSNGHEMDGRSDLYSLGITLFEMITGSPPFQASSLAEACQKHLQEDPPKMARVRRDVPASLDTIVRMCLAKSPVDRYGSASKMLADLEKVTVELRSGRAGGGFPDMGALPAERQDRPATPIASVAQSSPEPGSFGDRVVLAGIDPDGAAIKPWDLKGPSAVAGRRAEGGLLLPGSRVSGQHVRLDWDGRRLRVTDLKSTNGTRLRDVLLAPETPTVWNEGDELAIGGYRLKWSKVAADGLGIEDLMRSVVSMPDDGKAKNDAARGSRDRPESPARVVPGPRVTPPAQGVVRKPPEPIEEEERLLLKVRETTLHISPGQQLSVPVTLANVGTITDHWQLTVDGFPPGMVETIAQPSELNPKGQTIVQLTVKVPKSPDSRAATYPVSIQAHSSARRREKTVLKVKWTILPFVGLSPLRAEPPRQVSRSGGGLYTLRIRNDSNVAMSVALQARDDQGRLKLTLDSANLQIKPGAEASTTLRVWAGRKMFGAPESFGIRVTAKGTPQGGGAGAAAALGGQGLAPEALEKEANVQFEIRPSMPAWAVPAMTMSAAGVIALGLSGISCAKTNVTKVITRATAAVERAKTDAKTAQQAHAAAEAGGGSALVAARSKLRVAQEALATISAESAKADADAAKAPPAAAAPPVAAPAEDGAEAAAPVAPAAAPAGASQALEFAMGLRTKKLDAKLAVDQAQAEVESAAQSDHEHAADRKNKLNEAKADDKIAAESANDASKKVDEAKDAVAGPWATEDQKLNVEKLSKDLMPLLPAKS